MGSSFSAPASTNFPDQALSHVGPPPRRRLQKKSCYHHARYSHGSFQSSPCDKRFNFLQLQSPVEEPTRPQSPSPSARSIPGMRRFGIGSFRSVTKGQLRVVNASRPPTAISMDQCPMPSELWSENDDRNVLNAAYDSLAELTERWSFPDRLQSYEEGPDLMKAGLNNHRISMNSLSEGSCEESDVLPEKNSQDSTLLQNVPETYYQNVGECHHAPQPETEISAYSRRPRLLLRLRGILRAIFSRKK